MLSEISHTNKGKYHDLIYIMNLKKAELIKGMSRVIVARGWGVWEMGGIGPRPQTLTYEMNKFWGYNIVKNIVLCTWNLTRKKILNVFTTHTKKW